MIENQENFIKILPGFPGYDFCEEKYYTKIQTSHPFKKINIPIAEEIEDFIKLIYDSSMMMPETLIIALIYINRLNVLSEIPTIATNWRPLVLIAMLISHKVCHDNSLTNEDFSLFYPYFTLEEINHLEEKFLAFINFNTFVKYSVYLKYYLELKNFDYIENNVLPPIKEFKLHNLEYFSLNYEDNLKKILKNSFLSKRPFKGTTSTMYSLIDYL